jgi:hypothetical protein
LIIDHIICENFGGDEVNRLDGNFLVHALEVALLAALQIVRST